ncbi:MFS transporter [Chloroflexota bacterium]
MAKRLYLDRNLQIIFGVSLIAVMGVSSITPVFPTIIREFNITGGQVGLLITSFALPSAILAPFLGVMADRLGRKRILVPSLFLFAVAGTACAFIRDFNTLLIFRAFQGVGAAALGTINITILSDLYTGIKRSEAMGLTASVINIGTTLYPFIGGALALLGWNYPFALPILAVPIGILSLVSLKSIEPTRSGSIREYLSGTWKYLKNTKVISIFGTGVLHFIILFGAFLTYFALLLEDSFGASPFLIGLFISGISLIAAIVSPQFGRINKKFSLSTIIGAGFTLYAVALVLVPLLTSMWLLLIPVIVCGIAIGVVVPGILTVIANMAPVEYRAAFMSISSLLLRLGQALGPPLMGLIYIWRGFNATFFIAAALALLVPIIGTLFKKRISF